jgi:hypothetical protein
LPDRNTLLRALGDQFSCIQHQQSHEYQEECSLGIPNSGGTEEAP